MTSDWDNGESRRYPSAASKDGHEASTHEPEEARMVEDTPNRDATLLASSVRLPEHVVHRGFAAETVVLNLKTGKYHGLNPVGGRMLEVLEQTETVQQAARQLAAEYEQPIETIEEDLCSLCADLAARDLIETNAPGAD
ncbi:MAG: hypothetical protein AVDCRST_MAG67-525 [uncultured Solirubrobacteraceae bacterium]|uniref:Coenzyme PQQ synthesis protein D (PqqD) n=1 Tax=uncultured Solirubrobacteraceae bacterium TaxID=1162706 RepID=A0A6J4RVG1_9ACTN|nr:MAG: hypothetical protein AVDCRST_MAG67-525 [uncultured Solirubrobacteraceae bacterium]